MYKHYHEHGHVPDSKIREIFRAHSADESLIPERPAGDEHLENSHPSRHRCLHVNNANFLKSRADQQQQKVEEKQQKQVKRAATREINLQKQAEVAARKEARALEKQRKAAIKTAAEAYRSRKVCGGGLVHLGERSLITRLFCRTERHRTGRAGHAQAADRQGE